MSAVETLDPPASALAELLDSAHTQPTLGDSGRAAHSRRRLALDVLLLAACIAQITGWVEAGYWLWRQHVLGELVCLHPGYFWMSSVTQLALFAVPAALAALAISWLNRREMLPIAVTLFAFLGWLNFVYLFLPGLYELASVFLAAGLAATTGRLFRRFQDRSLWSARHIGGWLTAGLLIVAIVHTAWLSYIPSARPAALRKRGAASPNVLLIVLDAVRADALETYGVNRAVTSQITALAEQGVVFDNAWSTAPWTLPSHAGMFTGRLPHELSADWVTRLDDKFPTLAERLQARGWATGGFVGNMRYCSDETGLARGFEHYEAYRFSFGDFGFCSAIGRNILLGELPLRVGYYERPRRKRAPEVNRGLLNWLDQGDRRPYFAFVNYWEAHDPYHAPPEFQTVKMTDFDDALICRNWWWIDKQTVPAETIESLRTAYLDCIHGLDAQVGRLLEQLRQRGQLDNTLVIITSDHGEHFGEHELYLHGNSLYEPLLHVPLIVVWPGKIPAGRHVQTPVSLQGLSNTVLELLQIDERFPGQSWAGHWQSPESTAAPSEMLVAAIASQAKYPPCHGRSPVAGGALVALRDGNFKYIRNENGTEELFDLALDPDEQRNLIAEPDCEPVARRLRAAAKAVSFAHPAAK